MARYIVLPAIDPRGVPPYYIVDTSDNSRVRRYDCQVWAEHEARFRRIIEKLGGIL